MPTPSPLPPGSPCPCGLPRAHAACCGRFHAGEPAPTAEALMRSRYSAYVLGLTDYLRQTWHPDTRPAALALEPTQWLGLTVKATAQQDDDHAMVEFVARSREAGTGGGRAHRLHERSRFVRLEGRWLYLDGEPDPDAALSGAGASTGRPPR